MSPLSKAAAEEATNTLANAEKKLNAALHTAHRTDLVAGELDQAFEGAGNGINLVVKAFVVASSRGLRPSASIDAATQIRATVRDLRGAGIQGVPDEADLIWVNSVRNASVHEGTWDDNTDDVEEAVRLGNAMLAAVRRWLRQQGMQS